MNVVTVIVNEGGSREDLARSIRSALDTPGMTGVLLAATADQAAFTLDGFGHLDAYIEQALPRLHGLTQAERDRIRIVFVAGLVEPDSLGAAMNAAIAELASDTLVCVLRAGDEFYPEIKARQIELAKYHDVVRQGLRSAGSCSFSGHHDRETGMTRFPHRALWESAIYNAPQFATSTMVFSHDVWRALGGFDERLHGAVAWDFAMRVQYAIGWVGFFDVTGDSDELAGGLGLRGRARRRAMRVQTQGKALAAPGQYLWWHRRHSVVLPYAAERVRRAR